MGRLGGGQLDFADFSGKKILVVNVASECGYTPQYQQLQELYEYHSPNLVVVGCPCNDFGGQEPRAEEAIGQFCTNRFGVSFPMTEKISIKGAEPHPLYVFLTKKAENGISDSEVSWNFQKYLLDEKGQLIQYFSPATDPLDESILAYLLD